MQTLIGWLLPPKPKKLGPLPPGSYQERPEQNDALTGWVKPCTALTFITAGKVMPLLTKAPLSRLGGMK